MPAELPRELPSFYFVKSLVESSGEEEPLSSALLWKSQTDDADEGKVSIDDKKVVVEFTATYSPRKNSILIKRKGSGFEIWTFEENEKGCSLYLKNAGLGSVISPKIDKLVLARNLDALRLVNRKPRLNFGIVLASDFDLDHKETWFNKEVFETVEQGINKLALLVGVIRVAEQLRQNAPVLGG